MQVKISSGETLPKLTAHDIIAAGGALEVDGDVCLVADGGDLLVCLTPHGPMLRPQLLSDLIGIGVFARAMRPGEGVTITF